ncbi:hypothetical protein M8756_13650 [Lutimaribacter sp. EGI FJ00015]|uniref:Uncharacterized protein n=1 Tax=Lutimaribacter degradans TaxID=2945989 RepID=A0ACC5ZZC0_9RHOB|nr:hypothetical protein [Lutimaribacter sp. EGI FJ00013]MCM2563180.1 hypothetical protein [Lutimaribacter sp. EGI FJ00013]MCO0614359.1 hypothetical protein [Lutimaribacter sp. EGI FJ00015]MCO0637169.1 hypothetical protein [Lutimaribacter sp. EGI FJ00014]
MRGFTKRSIVAALAICLGAGAAFAQEEAQGAHVSIELNALEPLDDACRISFFVQNGHDVDITQAVYEAVLFDAEGRVDRLTLFDFGVLPANRPRVRQFVVPGLACAGLGRLLINGAETCAGSGLPEGACSRDLELRSRTDVEVIG